MLYYTLIALTDSNGAAVQIKPDILFKLLKHSVKTKKALRGLNRLSGYDRDCRLGLVKDYSRG